jgi:hypothetical protein
MDTKQALDELMEISSQIQAAVIFDGERVADSTLADEGRAGEIARAAAKLLEAGLKVRGDKEGKELVQIQATTRDGCVFVVRERGRSIAATTLRDPVPGLVFYDLKTCLRNMGEEEASDALSAKGSGPRQKAESAP